MSDQSIVRIFTADADVAGTGFLIPPRRVLTYTQVVARALGRPEVAPEPPEGEIRLDFPLAAPGEGFTARVIYWQPGPPTGEAAQWAGDDIAILEINEPPPAEFGVVSVPAPNNQHYSNVVFALNKGQVVTFLGAGASLVGRPPGFTFTGRRVDGGYRGLPTGGELAKYLARTINYVPSDLQDLLSVTQYFKSNLGEAQLYDELRAVFNDNYDVTPLHRFFARLPSVLRAKGRPNPHQFIVTTNYDDLMERAFESPDVREPYDLVSYVAKGDNTGKFLHRRYNGGVAPPETLPDGSRNHDYLPDGEVRLIERPNEYEQLNPERRSVILKIHGAVDRADEQHDSYVITEDSYIDFLARADISKLLPAKLAAKMSRSHFLFLGYSLRDWNLRVILYRLWGEQELSFRSWSILKSPHSRDQEFWKSRNVDVLNASLEDYIAELERRV